MSKFNVGDRVRFNDRCANYDSEVIVGSGDMGTITDISVGGYVTIELDSPEYITVQERDIQIVEPYNRKNAFLLELKELMSKYHAHFEVDFATQATYLIIGKERYPFLAPKSIDKE